MHSAVADTMESLSQRLGNSEGDTALGDLLSLVRTELLVVAVNSSGHIEHKVQHSNRAHTNAQMRADSSTLKKRLGRIIQRGDWSPGYWLKPEFEARHTIAQASPRDRPVVLRPSTGVGTDQSDKAPDPAQRISTEIRPDIEPTLFHEAQELEGALIDSTPGATFSRSTSQDTVVGEPPKQGNDVHTENSSMEGRVDAENITSPEPAQGTVQLQVAIDDIMSSDSSAPPSFEFRNAMSSETGVHTFTDLTVPTTSGGIGQEVSKVNSATGDVDQYSAAGSAAPYVDQYVDIITTSLLHDVDSEDLLTIEAELPSLLKECAIRIGHENHSAFHREMMFFAHKHHG